MIQSPEIGTRFDVAFLFVGRDTNEEEIALAAAAVSILITALLRGRHGAPLRQGSAARCGSIYN